MKLSRLGVLGVLASSHALAQPVPGQMVDGPSHEVQSFLPNILSTAGGGTVDLRLDYTSAGDSDLDLLAFNAHGQFISPTGLGGYAALPFAWASGADDSESGLGNLELGVLYAIRSSPTTDVLLRGGLALDSAGDDVTLLVPVAQISPKLGDAYTSGFETTWARLQAQMGHTSGQLRFGLAGGFDIPVDGALSDAEGFDGLLNVAASLGFQTPSIGLGFGIVFVHALSEGDSDDDTIAGFNATIDFPVGPRMRLFGALGIPDIDDNEGDIFAIGGGLRMGI